MSHPTPNELSDFANQFLAVNDNSIYEARKAFIVTLNRSYGVKRLIDIEPEERADAIQRLKDFVGLHPTKDNPMGPKFEHELEAQVQLKLSGEAGEVIGRAEYTYCENHYMVRYVAADGRQIEAWLGESAIEAAK